MSYGRPLYFASLSLSFASLPYDCLSLFAFEVVFLPVTNNDRLLGRHYTPKHHGHVTCTTTPLAILGTADALDLLGTRAIKHH